MVIKIIGIWSCIPEVIQENSTFIKNSFYNTDGTKIESPNSEIIEKFKKITGIKERRYANKDLNTSDLGFIAAKNAIENATRSRIVLANTTIHLMGIFPLTTINIFIRKFYKYKNSKKSNMLVNNG